jgi:hypothetical protein
MRNRRPARRSLSRRTRSVAHDASLAMVHLRLNANEANPNDAVNFITALPARTAAAETAARELLRALAAQVKPIMKAHGLVVNSFEEYEFNTVFAGRNWNNGQHASLSGECRRRAERLQARRSRSCSAAPAAHSSRWGRC